MITRHSSKAFSVNLKWSLDEGRKQETAMWQFAQANRHLHHADPNDYNALHAWSLARPEEYHSALWDFLDIIGSRGEVSYIAGDHIKNACFFPGASLNYAENLLRNADERIALIACREDGRRRSLTRKQLYQQVSRWTQALEASGVGPGDRVAAIVTNDVDAITAYLATAAIGAVWASCSPDFGPLSAADRLAQVSPKVLLAVSSYYYGGKHCDVRPAISAIVGACSPQTLQKVVLLDEEPLPFETDIACLGVREFLAPYAAVDIPFRRLPYKAPLAILFSSGTTGKPKCIVHSAMGLLLQHKKELALHCDITAADRVFYFTTCGWMMWNWQISALALEASLVIYEGGPFYPSDARLPELIQQEAITVFGTSARYIMACQQKGLEPGKSHVLSSLRLMLSTGSPLLPDGFDYIYDSWNADIQLASISGGTDICACFLGGCPILPVYKGELQCAMLGMDVAILDEKGGLQEGKAGELVCRNAHLSMPLGFWNDDDGSRYHEAYFSGFPDVWTHGDFVSRTHTGGYVIHGRSDTTLNPGGVRIGTAEIYRQLDQIAQVVDSVVVGYDIPGDQKVLLFVSLQSGLRLDKQLDDEIKQAIRMGASPRHVPALIVQVAEIPRTHSGKVSEMAVRQAMQGKPVTNLQALANPQCLSQFETMAASLESSMKESSL